MRSVFAVFDPVLTRENLNAVFERRLYRTPAVRRGYKYRCALRCKSGSLGEDP